jgi:uncharacterized delta-60 repeat protein
VTRLFGRLVRARAVTVLLTVAIPFGLMSGPAMAAPGDLDPTFSDDGMVTSGSNNGWMFEEPDFSGLTLQPNGQLVGAGDAGLVRFNSDGTYDGALFDFNEAPSLGAVTVQADGKLLAAGHSNHSYINEKEDFLVARYGPNGTPDPTFAGNGTATLDFAAREDQAKALAVEPGGKIVVVGYSVGLDSDDVPSKDFALARYRADGTLDPGFSGDGTRTTNFGGDDAAYDLAVQPDGKILVAGSSSGDFALARYEPDGRLDHTFSGDGKLTVRFGRDRRGTGALALVLRGDGRIVAAGGESGKFALVGLNPDGSRDSGFGGDGVVTTPFTGGEGYPSGAEVSDLALIGDRLLAAGRANADFALARYRLGGRLDPDFSADGKLRTNFRSYNNAAAAAIAVQGDGRVLVAGTATWYSLDEPWGDGAIARYLMSQGPADADADGVRDRLDLCPHVFFPQEGDGCPRFERSISLNVEPRELSGTIEGGCGDGARVTVYRVRHRRRAVFARATSFYDSYLGEYDYYVEARPGPGRYYVKVKRELRPAVGWCRAARSPAEVVSRR